MCIQGFASGQCGAQLTRLVRTVLGFAMLTPTFRAVAPAPDASSGQFTREKVTKPPPASARCLMPDVPALIAMNLSCRCVSWACFASSRAAAILSLAWGARSL